MTRAKMSTTSPSAFSRAAIITAIKEFYSILITLPYIPPSALVFPPEEGWDGVNSSELKARGKTDEVVELLRHLPYLKSTEARKRWMIGPDTVEIAYCDGELYDSVLDGIQPVPGHCIWLSDLESRDGTALLLDTHAGTITEWTSLGHRIIVDYEEYEKIPLPDKWMAHATMDAIEFFKLWKRKFERLLWMPIYNPRGRAGTAEWYIIAETTDDEADMLESDDDFEPDSESEEDSEDGFSLTSGEEYQVEDDEELSDEEINNLVKDAHIDENHPRVWAADEPQSLGPTTIEEVPESSQPVAANQLHIDLSTLPRKTREVYQIYTSAGWPSNFDREGCKAQLAVFLEREEGASSQLHHPLSEEEAIAMRQRMIEKHQGKLRRKQKAQDLNR